VPTVINPLSYIIGAAEVYYRAINVLTPWTSIGATVDDVVFRVTQSTFNPSDTINGLDDLIYLMDYTNGTSAEAEFTMPEIAGSKLALAIPGAISTAGVVTVDGAGLSTTLTAATAIGATSINVTATTNLIVGDWIRIDVTAGGLAEYRKVTAIAALVVSFRDPLKQAHLNGVAVVETLGDGATELTASTVRRQPAASYNDWCLVAQSPAAYYELYLYRAISTTEAVELSFGDETMAGARVTIGSRKDGADLTLPSWKLRVPAA
jgi:hypothetical protein